MNSRREAFERLRRANPQPVIHIPDRPDPRELMTGSRADIPLIAGETPSRRRPSMAVGPLLAAAVFVVILALGLPAVFMSDEINPSAQSIPDGLPELSETGPIESGRYQSQLLGAPLAIDIPGDWSLTEAVPGVVSLQVSVVGDVGPSPSANPVHLIRPTALADPADLSEPVPANGGWPLGDLEGWLDNLESRVVVSNVQSEEVEGYQATRFILRLDDNYPCGAESCAYLMSSEGFGDLGLVRGADWLVWWIDLGGALEPIVLVARVPDGNEELTETIDTMVSSIELGVPGPHPSTRGSMWELGYSAEAPAGEIRVPAFGGARFELPSPQRIEQSAYSVSIFPTGLTVMDLFVAQQGEDGVELQSAEDVASYLESRENVDASEISPSIIGGHEARVFEISGGPTTNSTPLWLFGEGDYMIQTPSSGRIWVADTERGPLVAVAATLEGEFGRDDIVAFAEAILPTLELIDGDELGN